MPSSSNSIASPTRSSDVLVIGGGSVGASVAAEAAARGASVTLLERGADLAWGCSAGNAGLLGASHVLPLSNMEALIDGIRWMARDDSPFGMRPRPRLLPWLAQFAAAAAPSRVRRSTAILRELAVAGAALHEQLAAEGLDSGFRRRGLLNVYGSERAFRHAVAEAERDAAQGMRCEVVQGADLGEAWPAVAGEHAGAVYYPDEAHCDPLRFVRAMGERARAAGARIWTGVEVLEIRVRDGRVTSVWTTEGDLTAGEVVLAAGVWSPRLTAGLPVRLPVEAGKGYHVDVETWSGAPEYPIWFQEDRIVATPLEGRLRLAGTLELSGIDDRIQKARVEAILRAGRNGLRGFGEPRIVEIWRGMRPCTPDGLPVIGRVPWIRNLVMATGHGMWGLQLGPLTGRLVAEVLTDATPSHDIAPLSPGRFGRGHAAGVSARRLRGSRRLRRAASAT